MRTKTVLTLVILLTLFMSGSAFAGHHPYGRHGGHHHSHHDAAGILIGAALIGTAAYAAGKHSRHVVHTRPAPVYTPPPAPAYWYRVDHNGDCMYVHLNKNGDEVWTPVAADNCQ
jgi:hypothetical protein